jgi:hypothetical protein
MGGPMGARGPPMPGMGPPGGLPGPPGMMGGHMGGGGRPAPPGGEEGPDAKRARLDFVLQPEEEFLEQVPGPSKVGGLWRWRGGGWAGWWRPVLWCCQWLYLQVVAR